MASSLKGGEGGTGGMGVVREKGTSLKDDEEEATDDVSIGAGGELEDKGGEDEGGTGVLEYRGG